MPSPLQELSHKVGNLGLHLILSGSLLLPLYTDVIFEAFSLSKAFFWIRHLYEEITAWVAQDVHR